VTQLAGSDRDTAPLKRSLASWFFERRFMLCDVTPYARVSMVNLDALATSIGADASSDIPLTDDSVAPKHARLERRDGRLMLLDLKSTGGSFVNGVRTMRAELVDGDRVRFGSREFVVSARTVVLWPRFAGVLVGPLFLTGLVGALVWWTGRREIERARTAKREEIEQTALASVETGIEEFRGARYDLAAGRLRYAADLLLLSETFPPGMSLEQPNRLFQDIVLRLPEADRDFDFEAVFDSASAATRRSEFAHLPDSVYVYREVQRIAVEVGQSENVPKGFAEKVWQYVQESQRYPLSFETRLKRSRTVQPKIEANPEDRGTSGSVRLRPMGGERTGSDDREWKECQRALAAHGRDGEGEESHR